MDEILVKRTLQGDKAAFSQLVAKYQTQVYGLALSMSGDFSDAEDLAQEAFLRAYVSLHRLREPARFGNWLYKITQNVCRRWLQRKVNYEEITQCVRESRREERIPMPDELAAAKELEERVRKAIDELPEQESLVTTLYYIDGLTYRDIADFTGVSQSTVKRRLRSSRERLKGDLLVMVQENLPKHNPTSEFTERVVFETEKLNSKWAFWTEYENIQLKEGDKVTFDAEGRILWDPEVPEPEVGPEGAYWTPAKALRPEEFLLPDFPIAALIGKVEEQVFGIGKHAEITITQDGSLHLAINTRWKEGSWDYNVGSLMIKVEVERRHLADTVELPRIEASGSPQKEKEMEQKDRAEEQEVIESESSEGEVQQIIRVLCAFDVYVDGQEISGELIKPEVAKLTAISGINSAELLERVAGEVPRYCIALDVDDVADPEVGEKLMAMLDYYSSDMANVTWGAYSKI